MSIKVEHIASGSSGNCILVNDGSSKLVFDAGLSYSKLCKRIRFSDVEAVFISHEHGDHCKAVPELLRRGVKVYSSFGTKKALLEKGWDVNELSVLIHGSQIELGSWYIKAFDLIHDAEEPLGFMYQSKVNGKKGIYIADSNYVQYYFAGVTHYVIEANYSEELLEAGDDPEWLKERIRNSHFSFEKLQQFFAETDTRDAEEIHLIHLSNRNSDAQRFVSELQAQVGVPVYVLN